jgi:hypothetical protein
MKSIIFAAAAIVSASAFAPAQTGKQITALQAVKKAAAPAKAKAAAPVKAKAAAPVKAKAAAPAKKAAAPVKKVKTVGASVGAFDSELGVQAPLGFFDPLGLLDNADQARFDRLRYVEIKHGRVAMLAFLGNIVTRAGIHLPGAIDYAGHEFSSFGNGWAALDGPNAIPQDGVSQILLFIGFLEASVMKDIPGTGNEFVGDFRNGAIDFGWDKFSEETKLSKRAIELNNGRAAMMGILGLMVHEQLGGELPIVGPM